MKSPAALARRAVRRYEGDADRPIKGYLTLRGGYTAIVRPDLTDTVLLGVATHTGASGGVGRAAAREFAKRGDKVALLARGTDGLRAAADEVAAAGGVGMPISVDVADWAELDAAADRVERETWAHRRLGEQRVLLGVRAVHGDQPGGTAPDHRGDLPRLRVRHESGAGADDPARPGSRGAGRLGAGAQSGYCAAKHAIYGLYESIRCELLHDGSNVRITTVQLPAVNTPQFDWVLSKLSRRPQPVPPIYQPEVAAQAIAYAADHPRRREYLIGMTTVVTVTANKVIPGLLDLYLARTGYKSQQTKESGDPNAPANRWEPVQPGRDRVPFEIRDRVGERRAVPRVAGDPFALNEVRQRLDAGEVGLRVPGGHLDAVLFDQCRVDGALQRGDFGGVVPLAPSAIRPASSTATRRPSRLSSNAVVRPVIPPPTTATSTVRSSVTAG